MASNLKRVSSLPLIDPINIGGEDLLYHVRQAPGSHVSYGVKLSHLFLGTNNLRSDIAFINNSIFVKYDVLSTNKIGINNASPTVELDVNGNLSVNQTVRFSKGTDSSSVGTGTLIVSGGVGISGSIWGGSLQGTPIGTVTRSTGAFTALTTNGATTLTGGIASSSTTTGTLVVTGGVGISGNVYAGSLQSTPVGSISRNTGAFTSLTSNDITTLTGNYPSTSTISGTLRVTGGVGVSGSIWAGSLEETAIGTVTRSTGAFTTLTTNGATTFTVNTASTSTTTGAVVVTGGVGIGGAIYAGSLQATPIGSTTKSTGAFTTLSSTNGTTFTSATASTSTTTGAVVVTGGVGIGGDVYAGSIQATPIGSTTKSTGAFTTLTSTNGTTFTSATASSNTTTGAVVVTGGVGIGGDVYAGSIQATPVGSTTKSTGAFTTLASTGETTFTSNTTSSSTTTGTVVVTGGVGVSGHVFAGGTFYGAWYALAANTKMTFVQSTAPVGWTKDIYNHDNHALRVVTGTASSGGSIGFTTAFASQAVSGNTSLLGVTIGMFGANGTIHNTSTTDNFIATGSGLLAATTTEYETSTGSITTPLVGPTSLTIDQMPAHTHGVTDPQHSHNVPMVRQNRSDGNQDKPMFDQGGATETTRSSTGITIDSRGGGQTHTHSWSSGGILMDAHRHDMTRTVTFTGLAHKHDAHTTSTFIGTEHTHTANGVASFTGTAINLAVQYIDVIVATKD